MLAADAAAGAQQPPAFGETVAEGVIRADGIDHRVTFIGRTGGSLLRLPQRDAPDMTVDAPVSLPTSLMLSADRRAAFLWDAHAQWFDATMPALRRARLDKARENWRRSRAEELAGGAAAMARPHVRGLLQYAQILTRQEGQLAQAEALLRAGRDKIGFKDDWQRIEWAAVTLQLANTANQRGDWASAEADYVAGIARMAGDPAAMNLAISYAALLAERGEYARALALVERTRASFLAYQERGDDVKVPGSMLQFDWIRACALKGLGRETEARAAIASAASVPQGYDWQFQPPPNFLVLQRAYACMRDPQALAALWRTDLEREGFGGYALLSVQPGYAPYYAHAPTLVAARADPALRAIVAERVRMLPDRFAAFLREMP